MYCSTCGDQLSTSTTKFCNKCGANLGVREGVTNDAYAVSDGRASLTIARLKQGATWALVGAYLFFTGELVYEVSDFKFWSKLGMSNQADLANAAAFGAAFGIAFGIVKANKAHRRSKSS